MTTPDFKAVFEALPGNILILQPNAPFYTLLAVSDEWLQITCQERGKVVGESVFAVYPENPEENTATGPSSLRVSLQKAIETQQPAHLPVAGYEILQADGKFEARYWSAQSKPVLNQAGEIRYLIHAIQVIERQQHEKARQEREAQITADFAGMRRLYELQSKLAEQTDVKAAFQDVLALACEFTGTDRGCVQFLSSDGERLEMFVWQGYADDSPFIEFFRYEGLEQGCEVARVQRQRLIIEETVGFEGLAGTEAGAASYADGIRAAQSTPMTSRSGETIGVISTQFRQPHRPSDHELRLMDMLAWTAAEFLERHRADVALRQSEQQFRLMADAVPQIVWLTDPEGRVEFFNQQWSDYTGVPYEPTTAAEVAASFVHPEDGAATMEAFTEARAMGKTFLVEHRIRSKTGEYRWFFVRAKPYRDANTGKIIRWFGASVDIHDRKQAEEVLEKAHKRLQAAMKVGRIFSFEMNPVTRALELSDNTETVMGFSLPDHIDSTFELIHPEDLQPTVDLINGAIEKRGSYASEYRLINPANGEVVWFHSQAAFTQYNASGEWRFVGIAQNITERKQAEERLRESESRYRTLFDSIDEGCYLLELFFDERGEVTDVLFLDANPAAIRMSGGDRRGKRLREVGNYEPYWYELYGRVARTGVSERTEQFSTPAGIWVDSYTFKIGEEGNRVAAVFQDVTERKQREANQAFLADFSQSLILLTTEQEIVQSFGEKMNGLNGAAVCAFFEINQRKDEAEIIAEWHLAGGFSLAGNYNIPELVSNEFQRSMMAGEVIVIRDISKDSHAKGKEQLASFGIGSFVNVPLIRSGKWQFVLGVYHTEAYDWREDEIDLLTEAANRIWTKLERARAEAALRTAEEQYRNQLEQKVTQRTAELKESVALIQSVFDTTLMGMSVLKAVRDEKGAIKDFKIQLANKELQREAGRTDLEEKLYAKEFPGIKQAGLFDLMLQVMESGEPAGTEFFYPYEGFNKWYTCMYVKLDDGLVETNLDITSRKQAEQELVKNYQILQQAEQVARMGSWEYDIATENFSWSEGMYRLFGLPMGTIVRPEIYLDYALPADLPIAEQIVQHIKEQQQPFEETLRIKVNSQEVALKIKAIVQGFQEGGAEKVLGVDVDISKIKQLEEKNLQMRLEQQKTLLVAILEAQEEERRRISESLHNGVGQLLYATKLNLDKVTKLVPSPVIQSTEKLLGEAIQETRRVSHELVPIILNDFGLEKAFQDLCSKYNKSTFRVNCEVEGLEQRLESYMEVAIYRICQELLNNVVKHAQATKTDILLVQEEGEITLKVRDNGNGMNQPPSQKKGLGHRTIADRVKLLNGTFSITAPAPGKGTLVIIRIPL